MKRIENWLNGRTAAIALHGMSIRGLRNHPFYRERDWAWATVNRWQVTENVLWPDLAPEQRPLGLVWMTSETEMAMIGNTLTTFLSRRESNLAAITLSAAHANPAVYNTLSRGELRDQVVVVPTPPKVSTSHPCGLAALNSAIALARVLIRCGARRLIFFGLDGVPPGAETAAEVASYVDERVFRNGNRDTQIARADGSCIS